MFDLGAGDPYQGLLVVLTHYALEYSNPVDVAGTQLLDPVIASVTRAFGGKVADQVHRNLR